LAAPRSLRRPAAPLALLATATARAALPQRQTPAPRGTCARGQRPWPTSAPRALIAPRAPRWLPPAQRARFPRAALPTLRFPRAAHAARATAWPLVACLLLQILARRAFTALRLALQVQPKLGALRATFAPPPPAHLHPHLPLRPAPWAHLAPAARLSRPPPRVARAARAFASPWQAIRPAQTPAHPATTAPPLPLDLRKTCALRATTAPRALAPSSSILARRAPGPLAAPPSRARPLAQPVPPAAAWRRAAHRQRRTSACPATTASLSSSACRRRPAARATIALRARGSPCQTAPRALRAPTARAEPRTKRCKTVSPARRARVWGWRVSPRTRTNARRATFAQP
jgi:hypothetical protein